MHGQEHAWTFFHDFGLIGCTHVIPYLPFLLATVLRSLRKCSCEIRLQIGSSLVVVEVLLYVHRNPRFIRDQDVHLDFHTAPKV